MRITPVFYRAISTAVLPLASLYLMWRSRRQPAYREFWDERFAYGTYPLRHFDRPRLWIHAVSVGETNAARPLLEAMLKAWPETDVLLTHMTPTGRDAGQKLVNLFPGRIHQCYLPYDAPYAVAKFFRQTRPTMGVIMETEVWPNLMEEAHRCQIPIVMANARESEKSHQKAQRFIDVMRPAFGAFTAVMAQSQRDEELLKSLGAQNVSVCGSLKFDIKPDPSQVAAAKDLRTRLTRPVLMMASTREGEEALLFEDLETIKRLAARTHLLVVPRHPQRFQAVYDLLTHKGLKVIKRSQIDETSFSTLSKYDVILGDSMGEMTFYCGLSTLTIMGGSFKEYGCQNVIEPAMAGSAIVVGPSIFNFEQIVLDGLDHSAMIQVPTAQEALSQCEYWLDHEQERQSIQKNAIDFAASYAGATEKMMSILENIWQQARKNESLRR